MTISWPATLPSKVLRAGFKETFPDTSIRTTMDAGPAKVRRRFVAQASQYSVSLFLTNAQVDYLRTFYVTTTESGTLPFNMSNPRTEITESFRFKTAPVITADGANFNAAFELEKLP